MGQSECLHLSRCHCKEKWSRFGPSGCCQSLEDQRSTPRPPSEAQTWRVGFAKGWLGRSPLFWGGAGSSEAKTKWKPGYIQAFLSLHSACNRSLVSRDISG